MILVTHIIKNLSLGGAFRSLVASAKYSQKSGLVRHRIVPLIDRYCDNTARFLQEEGVEFHSGVSEAERYALLEESDVVQVSWWNDPYMQAFLASGLPKCRLIIWSHVAGNSSPQEMTQELMTMADIVAPCCPFTMKLKEVTTFSERYPETEVCMFLDGADLQRVAHFSAQPHDGFRVGYIGSVDFQKMHPDFVNLCVSAHTQGMKFIVCGDGGDLSTIKHQAGMLGKSDIFEFKGYVTEIVEEIQSFDVYGYPLCPETYAAAELNLQEVMACGVPPVVFPYGGVRDLIVHNETGFIVHSPQEYGEALKFLKHNPDERHRLGKGAKEYSLTHYGAKNAAKRMNECYQRLVKKPKTVKQLGLSPSLSPSSKFVESLVSKKALFENSLAFDSDIQRGLDAELGIAKLSDLMWRGGIGLWSSAYNDDPYLHYWNGLCLYSRKELTNALIEFVNAFNKGFRHWRVVVFIERCMADITTDVITIPIDMLKEQFPVPDSIQPQFSGLMAFY